VADTAGVDTWGDTDGLSFKPVLAGDENAPEHDYVIYASMYGPAIVTQDGWKLRIVVKGDKAMMFGGFGASISNIDDAIVYQLYYLPDDYREDNDLAAENPEKLKDLRKILLQECDGNFIHETPNAHFAFYNEDVSL
jgi:arylsulfatase A-like enzyme